MRRGRAQAPGLFPRKTRQRPARRATGLAFRPGFLSVCFDSGPFVAAGDQAGLQSPSHPF
jgi:hypothetical protein